MYSMYGNAISKNREIVCYVYLLSASVKLRASCMWFLQMQNLVLCIVFVCMEW